MSKYWNSLLRTMENKKRKRSEGDSSMLSDIDSVKKSKCDHFFAGEASHLDQTSRSSYLASQAAQEVLAAIASGNASAINGGLAPPGLTNRKQRVRWREEQRRLALKNSESPHSGRQQSRMGHEASAATANASISQAGEKKRKRTESIVSINRDDIIAHFFAGAASHLDNTIKAAFIASPTAQNVIEAIDRGDADAIIANQAPTGLNKRQRKIWRDEQKALIQGPPAPIPSKQRKESALPQGPQHEAPETVVAHVSSAAVASNASSKSASRVKSESVGFTKLMRPPAKVWHEVANVASSHDDEQLSGMIDPTVFHQPQATEGSLSARQLKNVNSDDIAQEAHSWASRRSSNASNLKPHPKQSRQSMSNVVPKKMPGIRSFDIPDYFTRGTLEDTQRRFEAWGRGGVERGSETDSSDDESDGSESDEESERDEKSVIRGSFHESFADRINGQPPKEISEHETTQLKPDERVLKGSDNDDKDANANVQAQVSRELKDSTPAARDDTDANIEFSPAPQRLIEQDVMEIAEGGRASPKVIISAAEARSLAEEPPTIQCSYDDPEVRPSSPQSRSPGTTHGHPNAPHQANVRVKRILSQTNLGGDRSGHGPIEAPRPTSKEPMTVGERRVAHTGTFTDRLDKNELSDDLYEAIDDVASSLLGSVSSFSNREKIPSMTECKPLNNIQIGQNMDELLTNDASTVDTTNLGERADLMEGLETEDVDSGHKSETEENGINVQTNLKAEREVDKHKAGARKSRSSPSSSLSELSHTPSPPDALSKTHSDPVSGEPQVLVSPYVPSETPKLVREDSAKKTRKMTGRSSKHFGMAKRSKSKAASKQLQESPFIETPDPVHPPVPEQASSVYTTAVSRRTRSAVKAASQDLDVEASAASNDQAPTTPRQYLRPHSSAAVEYSPLSALEEALNAKIPDTPSETNADIKTAEPDEATQPNDNVDDQEIDTSSPQQFHTPPQQSQPKAASQPPKTRPSSKTKTPKSKPKSTGKISTHFITDRVDLYNTTSTSKRLPAGTSCVPVPSIHTPHFGIIQEKLWHTPFWLLIAVTFLNKTAGRSAVPIFWKLKARYPTPEALAAAEQGDLLEMVHKLGLQNQRSRRLGLMARAWCEGEPVRGRRYRTLNYPNLGDGRARDVPKVVEEDADLCTGALEIGHIPGCGDYAWDSWRVFCRDVLRGVADDYNGLNAKEEGFEPEWKRVLPGDKELRACLRWMWLREGWIWDPITGSKREADEEEMRKAVRGEMEIEDPQERKFAVQAAGEVVEEDVADGTPSKVVVPEEVNDDDSSADHEDEAATSEEDENESDTIVLAPFKSRTRRTPSRAVRVEPSIEEVNDKPTTKKNMTKKQKTSKSAPDTAPKSKRRPRTSSFRANDDEDYGEKRKYRRKSARLTL